MDEVSNYWFKTAIGDPAIDQLEVSLKPPNRSPEIFARKVVLIL